MRGGRPADADILQLPVVDRGAVAEGDLDFNDHANVMVYLRILIDTTVRGLAPGGLGFDYPPAYRCGLFAVDHHAQYLSELRLGDAYTTHVRLLHATDRAVHTMAYLRDAARGRVATTLESLFLNVDQGTRRVAPFAPEIRPRLAEFARRSAELPWRAATCGAIGAPGGPLTA